MSNFNMSQFFPGSAKITSKGSLLVENQKYSDDFNPRYVTPTSNRFNIQNSLVLPSIDKNVSHKKLNTPDMLASKSAKAGDGLNVKEALKDWLVGKSDVNIEDIFKQRFQQVKLSDKNNMSSKVIKTEDNNNSPAQPLIPIKKRRTLLRSQRYSQDIYETNSQSTLDSSYNKNIFEYQQPPMGGSAQTIQLPRVLELANEQNQQSSEVIRKSNSGQIRPTRKVSIDIFDEPSSSTTQPNEQQQSNTFEPKRISSQQVINYGNSLSNQRQSENIYTPSTQSKRSSFLDGSNNMTSNGGSNNNLPAPPSLFFSYRYGKNTNSPNESRGHTPVKYGSESKIPSSIFSQQSTTPNLSSFQNLDMISSLSNKKKESTSIFSINSSEFPSRQEIRSRRLQNKPIASSMGNIVLPDSLKQQLTKSILKDRSTNKERTLPPILKKSVIFSEKVEAFPI